MKIKIINPNTTQSMTDSIHEAACSCCDPETQIITVSPKDGPVSIENYHDEFASVLGVLEEIHLGVEEKIDAFVIACYGDPGLYAAREISEVPVVGIAEASMFLACTVSVKFSVVTVVPRIRHLIEEVVKKYGLWERCASVRTTNMGVLDFEVDPKKGFEEITKESIRAIEEDGAESICLGCAGMVTFAKKLEDELGVPVFDGVTAAVKMAESLVELGKTTSKVMTFKYPEKKDYKGKLNVLTP